MAEVLENLVTDLKEIRKYLIKIGQERRKGNISVIKLSEANSLYSQYISVLDHLKSEIQSKKISSNILEIINKSSSDFLNLYEEIIQLCSSTKSKEKINTMEKDSVFDLKIALSLLPVMNDDDNITKQLIENIEYYESTLNKPECKKNLITFILKSRLSETAKLKLDSCYDSVEVLLKDMRKLLLPQKSFTAVQAKLQRAAQNSRSIADYGKDISELFVDLTISQADGDSNAYKILKPINEKYAIKRFADGLRNPKLSTIIAARNYASLKDAIQAAQDEEVSTATHPSEIVGTYKSSSFRRNNRYGLYRPPRAQASRNRWQRGFYTPTGNSPQYAPNNYNKPYTNQRHNWRAGNRGRPFRGKSRGFSSNYVNSLATEQRPDESEDHPGDINLSHFFRA